MKIIELSIIFTSKLGKTLNFYKLGGRVGAGFIFFHFLRYKTPPRFGNLFLDLR